MLKELAGKTFFSIDATLVKQSDGELFAHVVHTPLRYSGAYYHPEIYSGVLTEEDKVWLAELFGEERFFIPREPGCYVGAPQLPITRVMLLSIGDRGNLHIRCTPLSNPLPEAFGTEKAQFIEDLLAACVLSGSNIIICGRSGIGKTRLMASCVLPSLEQFVYVETLPELTTWLMGQYPPPKYQYYTIMSTGLISPRHIPLAPIIQYIRSCAPKAVILQEAHTMSAGYASPDDLHGLVSSGVQFIVSAHAAFDSDVGTAQYYLKAYRLEGGSNIVIKLDSGISFVHVTAERAMPIYKSSRDGGSFINASCDIPERVREILERAQSEQ